MEKLVKYFRQSLEDTKISKGERRALKEIMGEKKISPQERSFLRNRIFEMAEEEIHGHDNRQVLEWLKDAVKILAPGGPEITSQVCFSPGNDCLDLISAQLDNACSTLDICVFTISDNRISEKILGAYKRGVQVRIITDNAKAEDRGSDVHFLGSQGIPLRVDRTDHHMHHKFAVVDKKILLTGSYNWTRSAGLYNQENILVTNDPVVTGKYDMEFERLWNKF